MQLRERKNRFIKNDISRDVNTPGRNIKTLVTLLKVAIAKKGTPFRTELKFVGIMRAKIWPTGTTKNVKPVIIWLLFEEPF